MKNPVSPGRCCGCNVQNGNSSELLLPKFPLSEYQIEYNKEYVESCPINKRFVSAGVPSKGKPECQPQEYDPSEGIVPQFKGESTCRSSYKPQPPISRLKSFKPSGETKTEPPMYLGPRMTEVQSYSHAVHSPMPLELSRKTAPFVPLWVQQMLQVEPYKTRYDLTTSYQADYCGTQTKPRKICLVQPGTNAEKASGNCCNASDGLTSDRYKTVKEASNDWRMWNYVNSLLYRTTTGSTYLPPSVHGEPICHPTKYHPNEDHEIKELGKVNFELKKSHNTCL